MTVLDALKLARRWWWVLVLLPLLTATATYVVSGTMTPVYRAHASLVIEESQSIAPTYSDIQVAQSRTTTYSRLIQERPILDEAIRRLGLTISAKQLGERVNAVPIEHTQIVILSVEDVSPQRAADLANAIGQVFIETTTAEATAISGSREDLQRGIDQVEQQVATLTSQISDLQNRADASTVEIQARIADLQSQLARDRAIYGTLVEARQSMTVVESQAGPRLRVSEPAIAPTEPVRPRVMLNTAVAGVLGLLAAAVLVALFGYLDDTIKTSDDVRRMANVNALGRIPSLRAKSDIEVLTRPRSQGAEAYRGLRTNLVFATLDRNVRSILISSPSSGDGKTTTAANLAIVLAQAGQRVILVDCDLRTPCISRIFPGMADYPGLSNLLLADVQANIEPILRRAGQPELRVLTNLLLSDVKTNLSPALKDTDVPGLRVLPTGPLPPNPADLLTSQRMRFLMERLEAEADIVIVDAPPLVVSDPMIAAALVDGVILVTRGGKTRSKDLQRAAQDMARTGTPLLGVVINRSRDAEHGYGDYGSYYGEPTAHSDSRSSSNDHGDGGPTIPIGTPGGVEQASPLNRRVPRLIRRRAGVEQRDAAVTHGTPELA
jgi:non-specific protein-tyrosine kinase